jgi:hypothetical protein
LCCQIQIQIQMILYLCFMMSADALLCFGSNTQISVVVLCCVVRGWS